MPKPEIWSSSEALVSDLKHCWSSHHFETTISLPDWERDIRRAVGSNTFRAFKKLPCRPSQVFREWAYDALVTRGYFDRLTAVSTQQDYERWLNQLVCDFKGYWQRKMMCTIPFGPSYKLPNLLMKVVCQRLSPADRNRIVLFLHVPLDSYTLSGIRNFITLPDGQPIPKTATMKFVDNHDVYSSLQNQIRELASRAGVPAIAYDYLAWDQWH